MTIVQFPRRDLRNPSRRRETKGEKEKKERSAMDKHIAIMLVI